MTKSRKESNELALEAYFTEYEDCYECLECGRRFQYVAGALAHARALGAFIDRFWDKKMVNCHIKSYRCPSCGRPDFPSVCEAREHYFHCTGSIRYWAKMRNGGV